MTDDPAPQLLPTEDLAQLRERAAAAAVRTRELIEVARELRAQAASLLAERAMLVDEVHSRRTDRGKVDPFP